MRIIERSFTYRDRIKVSREDLDLAKRRRKTCTIRLGRMSVAQERLLLSDGHDAIPIRVTDVDTRRVYAELTDSDAQAEGLDSLDALRADLARWYGQIDPHQPITVIHFEMLCEGRRDR